MLNRIIDIVIPKTKFGLGAISHLPEVIQDLGGKNILLVTDMGIVNAGILNQVCATLEENGISHGTFDRCGIEAPMSNINEIVALAKKESKDILIGIGGGSTMDCTKAASILATNDALSADDLLSGNIPNRPLLKILIPTTSGTGSEWSSASVITTDTSDGLTKPYFTAKNFPVEKSRF